MHAHAAVEPKLPRSIADLMEALRSSVSLCPTNARDLLTGLDLDVADLAPWQDFDHPVRDSYGRILLGRGDNFELMLMSWAPGDYSAIHDHGAAEWGAVRYFGPADHVLFSEEGNVLSIAERMTMQVDDVVSVDHSLIHLMGNPTAVGFTSLHLYGRQQASESITGGARVFDLAEERIQRTDGGVFFCLPEREIQRREPCPRPDAATRQLHHGLMLRRIERMLATGPSPADKWLSARARWLRAELGVQPVELS